MIDLRLECPECKVPLRFDDIETTPQIYCQCGWTEKIDADAIQQGRIERCPVCKTDDLYIQKDFPERVGVALVVFGLLGATIAWAYYSWFWTFGILFGSFAIDWTLFRTRKDVTVCYRCLAQFRKMAPNPENEPFDLAIGERYRQERMRKEQMEKQQEAAR